MHGHVNAWLTLLILLYLSTYGINEWAFECMFMASSKKYKENPNLSMLKANKLLKKGTETWKHKKGNETETYYVK